MIPRLAFLFVLFLINPLVSNTRASEAAASASASTSRAAEEAEALPYTPAAAAVTASASASSAAAAHAFGDFNRLPRNVIRTIATFLSLDDITQVGRTCQEGGEIIPDLYTAHLLSRLSTLRDTGALPSDLSRRHFRALAHHHPETVKKALNSVFNPRKEPVFSVPSSAASLFSDVPGINPLDLDHDTLRDLVQVAITSTAEPGHAWDKWQDIALTHFLSDTTLYKTGTVTDAEVARVIASLVSEFHACGYISLAAYLGGSVGTPVATKAEVRDNMDALNARLADNPDQRVVIDLPIETDEDGAPVVTMDADDIPANLRNLAVVSRAREPHKVGTSFLFGCTGLTKCTLALLQATAIEDEFLARCTGLIFFAPYLPNVTRVGDEFLYRCTALASLSLYLPNVTEVGDEFLCECTELIFFALCLPNGTEVGYKFLYGCRGAKRLSLYFPEVTTVADRFLDKCTRVEKLFLYLPNATETEEFFLHGFSLLRSRATNRPLSTSTWTRRHMK